MRFSHTSGISVRKYLEQADRKHLVILQWAAKSTKTRLIITAATTPAALDATFANGDTMGANTMDSGGSSPANALRKVNSETKFAVSLLLAVSGGGARGVGYDGGATPVKVASSVGSPDVSSERSSCSAETRVHTASESPASSSQVAYVMQRAAPGVLVTSPRLVGPTLPAPHTQMTPEEQRAAMQRQAALARFRAKKQRRHFHKKVRYLVRKKLAESRPRHKGRFSKPPAEQDDSKPTKTKDCKSTAGSTKSTK